MSVCMHVHMYVCKYVRMYACIYIYISNIAQALLVPCVRGNWPQGPEPGHPAPKQPQFRNQGGHRNHKMPNYAIRWLKNDGEGCTAVKTRKHLWILRAQPLDSGASAGVVVPLALGGRVCRALLCFGAPKPPPSRT